MPPEDSTAYYTLVATILIGVIVLAVVQLQEISRSVRARHAPLAVRSSLVALTLVAIVSVLALAETPRAARGAASWLTYRMAEWLVALLLGVSLLPSILTSGSAAFSRQGPEHTLVRPDDKASHNSEGEPESTPRWLMVLLVVLAIALRRR